MSTVKKNDTIYSVLDCDWGDWVALYAISDLHLPLGVNKPMDIFGSKWENYVERLFGNWQSIVKSNDTVVLPGDFSWATYINDAKKDFEYLNKLNGKKILLKGNHDYWWETMSKMKKFLAENGFDSISILQNNSYLYKDIAICGTRGWIITGNADDKMIYEREYGRLELSLKSAPPDKRKFVFLHYPPILPNNSENPIIELMKKYNVEKCIYGHLHAKSSEKAVKGEVGGIKYLLVSCDYLGFMPIKLSD